MSALHVEFDKLDWDAVAASADRGDGPAHICADALSFSALFTNEFEAGVARVTSARESDPFNPLHALREVLLLLRFGESARALGAGKALQEELPAQALPAYLRALASYHEGEFKRAANAAAEIITDHPSFAPARFLQAQSQLRFQFKGLRKLLTGLPRGAAHASKWLEITATLVLAGSEEGKGLAAEVAADSTIFSPGSCEQALAQQLLELSGAALEQLETRLAATRPGSRAEELVLLFFSDRLDLAGLSREQSLETLRGCVARFPDRPAVRRVYVVRLTRMAVDLASREKFVDALRLIERCLQLEPHETAHYQNRAAIFTLLREPGAYHDAWFELDRHQFRRALLGEITAKGGDDLARSHRLFAQQARLSGAGATGSLSSGGLGFLVETTRTNQATGAVESILAVNNERLEDDPELLRQYIHHRRAELVFGHCALGHDARRFLLDPESVPAARARLASLESTARSLQVLVPEEGRLLAARLAATWIAQTARIEPAYAALTDDADIRAKERLHLETFADLALLCLTWKLGGHCAGLVEEVLAFLYDEAPFFDDESLTQALRATQTDACYSLKLLAGFINDALGLDPSRTKPLNPEQRAALTGRLAAELLTRMAYRSYDEQRRTDSGARGALAYIERACAADPDNVQTELAFARFLLIAGRDQESRAILTRLQRSARAREPEVHSQIAELRRILDERAGGGTVAKGAGRLAPLRRNRPARVLPRRSRSSKPKSTASRPRSRLTRCSREARGGRPVHRRDRMERPGHHPVPGPRRSAQSPVTEHGASGPGDAGAARPARRAALRDRSSSPRPRHPGTSHCGPPGRSHARVSSRPVPSRPGQPRRCAARVRAGAGALRAATAPARAAQPGHGR